MLIVEILEVLDAISVSLDAMLEAFVVMLEVLDAISVSLELIFVELVLILDSTSDKRSKVKVPSISASFRIVTV